MRRKVLAKVKLGGHPWRVVRGGCPSQWHGCVVEGTHTIHIHERTFVKPKKLLDVMIHEGLHATCPWMAEDTVTTTASELARMLWSLGVRVESSPKK